MKDADRYDENGRKMEVSDYDGEKKMMIHLKSAFLEKFPSV